MLHATISSEKHSTLIDPSVVPVRRKANAVHKSSKSRKKTSASNSTSTTSSQNSLIPAPESITFESKPATKKESQTTIIQQSKPIAVRGSTTGSSPTKSEGPNEYPDFSPGLVRNLNAQSQEAAASVRQTSNARARDRPQNGTVTHSTKDPQQGRTLRSVRAVEHLRPEPESSPIQVTHLGSSVQETMSKRERILHYMRQNCGRQAGMVDFKESSNSKWLTGLCVVHGENGSLIYQDTSKRGQTIVLIENLRGCHVQEVKLPSSSAITLAIHVPQSGQTILLTPHASEMLEIWLAAFLCWSNITQATFPTSPTEASFRNPTLPPVNTMPTRKLPETPVDSPVIKVGKMIWWADSDATTVMRNSIDGLDQEDYSQGKAVADAPWQLCSATLWENGTFRLVMDKFPTKSMILDLTRLKRSAIQKLDRSVLGDDLTIVVFPMMVHDSAPSDQILPLIVSLESQVYFEAWFACLQIFTYPLFHGLSTRLPSLNKLARSTGSGSDLEKTEKVLRLSRTVSVKVAQARLHSAAASSAQNSNFFVEIKADGFCIGRTCIKQSRVDPAWYESFCFDDVSDELSSLDFEIQEQKQNQYLWNIKHNLKATDMPEQYRLGIAEDIYQTYACKTTGVAFLDLETVSTESEVDLRLPILREDGSNVGELILRVQIEDNAIPRFQLFQPLVNMLGSNMNSLNAVFSAISFAQSKKLPETILNVYQGLGKSREWLMSLVENEMDDWAAPDQPNTRYRYNHRMMPSEFNERGIDRDIYLRDLGKTAATEANLLFRGNSLLTHALDAYMRTTGREYLILVVGPILCQINLENRDFEVDRSRQPDLDQETLALRWKTLIKHARKVWHSIRDSVDRCPVDLRVIFRHIRSCADDKFGNFRRTVRYTSVSAFLFLRFICPAILNPYLLGVLESSPKPNAQRTFTLLAKTFQTMANTAAFGSKEQYMDPMNVFLNAHQEEFRDFIDKICSITMDQARFTAVPSYQTPRAMTAKLPPLYQEGVLILPFLIDLPRALLGMVNAWLENSGPYSGVDSDNDVARRFDALCSVLRSKISTILNTVIHAPQREDDVLDEKQTRLLSRRLQLIASRYARTSASRHTRSSSFASASTAAPTLLPTLTRRMTTGSVATGRDDGQQKRFSKIAIDQTESDAIVSDTEVSDASILIENPIYKAAEQALDDAEPLLAIPDPDSRPVSEELSALPEIRGNKVAKFVPESVVAARLQLARSQEQMRHPASPSLSSKEALSPELYPLSESARLARSPSALSVISAITRPATSMSRTSSVLNENDKASVSPTSPTQELSSSVWSLHNENEVTSSPKAPSGRNTTRGRAWFDRRASKVIETLTSTPSQEFARAKRNLQGADQFAQERPSTPLTISDGEQVKRFTDVLSFRRRKSVAVNEQAESAEGPPRTGTPSRNGRRIRLGK